MESLNSNKASKSWRENNVETVRVTVSDGKGGSDVKEIHVRVGQLNGPFAIRGRVIAAGGVPVQGARVSGVNGRQAWTDGDGNYALFHLGRSSPFLWFNQPADVMSLRAQKAEMRFEPLFSNLVYFPAEADFFGHDWVAMGDGPATGSLQLAVTPYQTEIPIRSQVQFRALAWDASGKRIEANPTWSATEGGTISQSGLFIPTEAGGPFRITATQAGFEGHAFITITEPDMTPLFATDSGPGDQSYTVGTAIPTLTLPESSPGNGALTYSLSPEVPGLNFNTVMRQLTGSPTTTGAYLMAYTVTDEDGDTDTLSFTITITINPTLPGTPFYDFMLDYPAITVEERGYDADPDGDGRSNLVEYAMGGDPDVHEAYPSFLEGFWFNSPFGSISPSFRYTRRRDAASHGLRYEPQWSRDLSNWYSFSVEGGVTLIDETFEEVWDDGYTWSGSRMFYRIKIHLDTGHAPVDQTAFDALFVGKQYGDSNSGLIFLSPGRIREFEDGIAYEGDYEFENTGPNKGTLTYTYDATSNDPAAEKTVIEMTFTSQLAGAFVSTYTIAGSSPRVTRASFGFTDTIDAMPSFAADSNPGNQTYTAGTAIDTLTLPEASGGDGALTYSLSPDVPGLNFNPVARQLTGTPTTAGAHSITYTITDEDGDTDTLSFTITIQPKDRAALVALYEATDGPNWAKNTDWLTDAPLGEWYGVEVDELGRVIHLDLSANQLSGSIPTELGNLASLETLNLRENELSGPIPAELGRLTNLKILWLAQNQLTGPIPPSFGNLANVSQMSFASNQLSGALPAELGGMARLKSAQLQGNDFTGMIPSELGNLTKLEELFLGGNKLTGLIPPSFLQLNALVTFSIEHNEGLCVPGTSAFVAWTGGIEGRIVEPAFCNAADVAALRSFFEATNGEDWTESVGWLTDSAVEDWHGVSADSLGHVTKLDLAHNGLAGRLPATLGNLGGLSVLRIGDNALSGRLPLSFAGLPLRDLSYEETDLCAPADASFQAWLNGIPSHDGTGLECAPLSDREILEILYDVTDGPNWVDNTNWLTDAPLNEWEHVGAHHDRVQSLWLQRNGLKGRIPPELGGLANLQHLWLMRNDLTGPIPPELGGLANLRWLWIEYTDLTGPIPPELSNLASLYRLYLSNNNLTGQIPAEFGAFARLLELNLANNGLTGGIPPELGSLKELEELRLAHNHLAGPVPPELGGMSSLRELSLSNNPLQGALPAKLSELRALECLLAGATGLCADPLDPGFQAWLAGVRKRRIAACGKADVPPAYLVQAAQSREFPVPLVAGEKALLRVFPTANRTTSEGIPSVRARFFLNGRETQVVNIPGKSATIPTYLDESSLSNSANAEIPGKLVQPGLEMVIEVDPESTLDPGLGVARRIPETGRLKVDVAAMPPFPLTVIPFLWSEKPDSLVLDIVAAMAQDPDSHELLEWTRTLLPIKEFALTAHEPVISSHNTAHELSNEAEAIRVLEGGRGYYMATITGERGSWHDGLADGDSHRTTFAALDGEVRRVNYVIAHELGHNLRLDHTPGCGAEGEDYAYPHANGRIGVWGYDFSSGSLIPPTAGDLMSYCGADWISDYHFTNALRFRLSDEGTGAAPPPLHPVRSLLLWGGVSADSVPYLEPAFVVNAPPAMPDSVGEHRLTGRTADGVELFSLGFPMPDIACGDGGSSFVFALPAQPGWEGTLATITLSGPGGSFTLDGESDLPMAILRNLRTGQVRGFLRDSPLETRVSADGTGRTPADDEAADFEVLFSRGIPDAAAWLDRSR